MNYVTGPAVYVGNETDSKVHRIIGIVSFGFRCASRGIPGYYASVYPQLEWIQSIVNQTNTCTNVDKTAKNGLQTCSAPSVNIAFLRSNLIVSYLTLIMVNEIML